MTAIDAAELSCHAPVDADVAGLANAASGRLPVVALVGRPNVGKSTFFARATGRYAETSDPLVAAFVERALGGRAGSAG